MLLINNLSKENNKLKEKLTEVELKRPIELTGQGAESFCLAIQLSEMKQKLDKVTNRYTYSNYMENVQYVYTILDIIKEANVKIVCGIQMLHLV